MQWQNSGDKMEKIIYMDVFMDFHDAVDWVDKKRDENRDIILHEMKIYTTNGVTYFASLMFSKSQLELELDYD